MVSVEAEGGSGLDGQQTDAFQAQSESQREGQPLEVDAGSGAPWWAPKGSLAWLHTLPHPEG